MCVREAWGGSALHGVLGWCVEGSLMPVVHGCLSKMVLESNCYSKDKNKLGLVLISTILYSKINTWSQIVEFFDFASQSHLLSVV